MKYIFFGTPQEATIVLDALQAHGHTPVLIVTAPDRPSGRGLHVEASPVAIWGEKNHVAVIKPESLKDDAVAKIIQKTNADVAFVFAYGKIIPQAILEIPKHGMINIHPSLLPLHRGPSPVEGAILSDNLETGVSIMLLDKEMDHGPLLAQEKITIQPDETVADLLPKLITLGANKLAEILPTFIEGKVLPTEQDHSLATYTNKIKKIDGEISLSDDPALLYKKYRAYFGWPGLYYFDERNGTKIRISIKKARYENGNFIIERIVPEGKKEISYDEYLKHNK